MDTASEDYGMFAGVRVGDTIELTGTAYVSAIDDTDKSLKIHPEGRGGDYEWFYPKDTPKESGFKVTSVRVVDGDYEPGKAYESNFQTVYIRTHDDRWFDTTHHLVRSHDYPTRPLKPARLIADV